VFQLLRSSAFWIAPNSSVRHQLAEQVASSGNTAPKPNGQLCTTSDVGSQPHLRTRFTMSNEQYQPPGYAPPRRTDTDILPQGTDRTEQIETLQTFEAGKEQSQADKDQETLAREYPKIDSSLIAAIYSDSNSLGATREMLQALSADEGPPQPTEQRQETNPWGQQAGQAQQTGYEEQHTGYVGQQTEQRRDTGQTQPPSYGGQAAHNPWA
jgi:hypothetical protein